MRRKANRGNRYFDHSTRYYRDRNGGNGDRSHGNGDDKDGGYPGEYRSDDYRPDAPSPNRESDWRVQNSPPSKNSAEPAGLRQNRHPPQLTPSRRRLSPTRKAYPLRGSENHKRDPEKLNLSHFADYKVDRSGGQDEDDDEDDDWGFVRKGRKHVRNGRIAKRVKVNEVNVHTSLFCQTCQLTFRNVNEKLAHEMSKDHITQSERSNAFVSDRGYANKFRKNSSNNFSSTSGLASIGSDEFDLDHTNVTPHSKHSVNTPGTMFSAGPMEPVNPVAVANEIDNLIREGFKFIGSSGVNENMPPSFKTWAERSLSAIESKIASGEADPSEKEFVNKEVVYTLTREIRNSTLFRVDWRNVELATGDVVKPKLAMNRNYTLEEIEGMEALYQEDHLQEQIAGMLPVNPLSKVEEKTNSRPTSSIGAGVVSGTISKSSLELKTSGHTDSSEARPRAVRKLIEAHHPGTSERGRILSHSCGDIPKGLVLQWHGTRSSLSSKDESNHISTEVKSAILELPSAENRVSSGNYDASSDLPDIENIGTVLLDANLRLKTAIHAFELCLRLAIDARDHLKVAEYSDLLANMYVHHGFEERNSSYFALCLLSLAYSRSPKTSRTQSSFFQSPIFLVSKLRQIPSKSLGQIVVSEAFGALVAFYTNNWVDFLRYYKDPHAHSQAEGYTNEVCSALVSTVHERALLTMFRGGCGGKCPYDYPGKLEFRYIMASLSFGDEGDIDRVALLREIMQNMVDPLWIRGSATEGANALVECEDKKGRIGGSVDVNMSLLLGFNGDSFHLWEDRRT